jgi:hypothetical protein
MQLFEILDNIGNFRAFLRGRSVSTKGLNGVGLRSAQRKFGATPRKAAG